MTDIILYGLYGILALIGLFVAFLLFVCVVCYFRDGENLLWESREQFLERLSPTERKKMETYYADKERKRHSRKINRWYGWFGGPHYYYPGA